MPRRDLALPNGNQKRQREAAIETATRNGKQTVARSREREAGSRKRGAGNGKQEA
ncbi:MAG: hypothetical protein ACLP2U_04910 [Syntrophobacteraceae bacterium]